MKRSRSSGQTKASLDDPIGYARPPVHTRFRSGKSGNPKGRPRNSRNLATIIKSVLASKVTVREDGHPRKISKLEAMVLRQVENAMKGSDRAALAALRMAVVAGLFEPTETDTSASDLTPAEQKILNEFLNRSGNKRTKIGKRKV